MGTNTENFGLFKPDGSDAVSRVNDFNNNWDAIDELVAPISLAQRPFYIDEDSIVYDSGNNRFVVSYGAFVINVLGAYVSVASGNHYINSPNINTDYYLFIDASGNITNSTSYAVGSDAVRMWKITSGASLSSPVTVQDQRDEIGSLSAKVVADDLSGHIDSTAAHGATGQVVGTTNEQTISNKTLNSPIINTPDIPTTGSGWTNAQHGHAGASTGGQISMSNISGAFSTSNPSTIAFGDAPSHGSGTVAAKANHVHGGPSFATPNIALGSSVSAGTSGTPIRSNATIKAFDDANPVPVAISSSTTTSSRGASSFASRDDHVHGAPSTYPPSSHDLSDAVHGTNPLNIQKGGTNASLSLTNADKGAILYYSGGTNGPFAASPGSTAGTLTTGKILLSSSSGVPTWSTGTFPLASGNVSNNVVKSDGNNNFVVGSLDHASLSNPGNTSHANIDSHIDGTNNPHGTTGGVVGVDSTQYLTNKRFSRIRVGDNVTPANGSVLDVQGNTILNGKSIIGSPSNFSGSWPSGGKELEVIGQVRITSTLEAGNTTTGTITSGSITSSGNIVSQVEESPVVSELKIYSYNKGGQSTVETDGNSSQLRLRARSSITDGQRWQIRTEADGNSSPSYLTISALNNNGANSGDSSTAIKIERNPSSLTLIKNVTINKPKISSSDWVDAQHAHSSGATGGTISLSSLSIPQTNNDNNFSSIAHTHESSLQAGTIQRTRSIFINAINFLPVGGMNAPTLALRGNAANFNKIPSLNFSGTTDEQALTVVQMPYDWNLGDVTPYIYWTKSSTVNTSDKNQIVWQIYPGVIGSLEQVDKGSSPNNTTSSYQVPLTVENLLITQVGNDFGATNNKENIIRFSVKRVATAVLNDNPTPPPDASISGAKIGQGDTYPDDIWLIGVRLDYNAVI